MSIFWWKIMSSVTLHSYPVWSSLKFRSRLTEENKMLISSGMKIKMQHFDLCERTNLISWSLKNYRSKMVWRLLFCTCTHYNNLYLFSPYFFSISKWYSNLYNVLNLPKAFYCSFGSIFWESLCLHNEVWFFISMNHLPTS